MSELGYDWIDEVLVPRPGTCPYPLSDDISAAACIARGECGCDEQDKAGANQHSQERT